MISEFGKCLIDIRKKNKQNIVEMSQKLNLGLSFLSRIEQSKDYIDESVINKIIDSYNLDKASREKLYQSMITSNNLYERNKDNSIVESDIDLSRKVEIDDDLISKLKGVLNDKN